MTNTSHFKSESNNLIWVVSALAVSIALKGWLVVSNTVPFNSDEAVVALMARHILGGERPVFFYGQAYMGSLDAWLVATGFWIFGQHVWVIRFVQALLYLGVILTTIILGRKIFSSWRVGALAAWMMAIPTINVTLYTTASLGGYGEALLIGNLLILTGWQISKGRSESGERRTAFLWFLWGLLAGLGLWAFGITLIYSLPVGAFLIWHAWSRSRGQPRLFQKLAAKLSLLFVGVILGALPWWIFALRHGFEQLLWELRGGAIAGVENLSLLGQVIQHLINLLLLGSTVTFGFRPPWSVTWLVLPLIPLVLIFWMGVIAYTARQFKSTSSDWEFQANLLGVVAVLLGAFIFTPFGADPSGRYFVPLMVPMALFAARMIVYLMSRYGYWALGLFALVLLFNFVGTLQSAFRYPPGITTQFYEPTQVDHRYDEALIDFLHTHGESRGYGNYWVTYPLAFLSKEELIFVPRLPYHLDFRYTNRDDRYSPYDELVSQSDRVAYITTRHPSLDAYLAREFSRLNLSWKESQIGDYHVFYDLSRKVVPEEIGLGMNTP